MNNLSKLLSKRNIEIFYLISNEELSLREVAEKIKCSPGKVHQAIKLFKEYRIIQIDKYKNKFIIKPLRKNPVYKKIKSLINIINFINSRNYKFLKKLGLIGVYGSYAEGIDDSNSDIDLLILTNENKIKLQEKVRELENELGKRINPLILTKEKLEKMEKNDKEFYIRLKLTTIELNGDIFG